MRPAPFALERPGSVSEAVALLSTARDAVRALAGGQALVAQLTRRELSVDRLVDLAGIRELRSVDVGEDGSLRLGAMVTIATLEDDPRIAFGWPLLAAAARHVGHRPIRNRATVGGSIAFADPPAEVPLALAVLGAEVRRVGPLITAVSVPPGGDRWGFHELARRPNDRAIAVAAAASSATGEIRVRVATGSGAPQYLERAARVCGERALRQAAGEVTP